MTTTTTPPPIVRTAARERFDEQIRAALTPGGSVFSAGRFVIRGDGTARFDRHHHEYTEMWLIVSGCGTVALDDTEYAVAPGDIVVTTAGVEHDIVAVAEEMTVFWVSFDLPEGASTEHLHRDPQQADKHLVPVRHAGGQRD
jgi:mannose-6-phosphate isomerase-like protein (cupin superfamily)